MALVCSLLLEDFSSVELKDTRDLLEKHQLRQLFFSGNNAFIVEMWSIVREGGEGEQRQVQRQKQIPTG
jgi:hypothetical protein